MVIKKKKKIKYRSVSLYLFHKHQDLVTDLFMNYLKEEQLSRVSMTKSDFKQELLIKLYLAINKFIEKIINGEEENFDNIRNYLFIALKNRYTNVLKDIIKNSGKYQDLEKIEDDINFITEEKKINVKVRHLYFDNKDLFSFLNKKERKVFRKFVFGYKVNEIVLLYGYPEGTVLSIIRRCRRKIKQGLGIT